MSIYQKTLTIEKECDSFLAVLSKGEMSLTEIKLPGNELEAALFKIQLLEAVSQVFGVSFFRPRSVYYVDDILGDYAAGVLQAKSGLNNLCDSKDYDQGFNDYLLSKQ